MSDYALRVRDCSRNKRAFTRHRQVDRYFYGNISERASGAGAALGNARLAAEVFVARVARIWNAATRSAYVNCNGKRAGRRQQPLSLAFRNASLRSTTAIYTQIALHDPEQAGILYFTLLLRPFAPATLKAPGHWNVRTRCAVCRRKFLSTLRRMGREEGCRGLL